MLSASNGIHAVTYDAVVVTASFCHYARHRARGHESDLTWHRRRAALRNRAGYRSSSDAWSVAATSVQGASVPALDARDFSECEETEARLMIA
jgi:hypothetical protein